MRQTEIDDRIQLLAARQHLVFSRRQAAELGASDRFIGRRVQGGSWIRFEPSVFGLTGFPVTWERRLKAAELGAPGSAVAGIAAAALHQLPGFRPCRAELVVPPGVSSRGKIAVIHRQIGCRTTSVAGITTTTIAQTLFDIAGRVPLERLERAIDDPLTSGRLVVGDLEERLAFYEGSRRAGMPRMRALVGERSSVGFVPSESELEAVLDRVLSRLPGRSEVVRQAGLPWRDASPQRVDRFLPQSGIIIEADGRRWHTRVADFDRDRWRDNEAVAHGLRVLRFTYAHLTQCPDDVLEIVGAAQIARWAA